jgi:hypothetical protein
MTSTELHKAFIETRYIVKACDLFSEEIVLRIGQPAFSLEATLPNIKQWAFITASNPLPNILTPAENHQRHIRLRKLLLEMGYPIYEAVGISADGGWQEESLLVANISLKEANAMANRFGQLAFVFGTEGKVSELVYTGTGIKNAIE